MCDKVFKVEFMGCYTKLRQYFIKYQYQLLIQA